MGRRRDAQAVLPVGRAVLTVLKRQQFHVQNAAKRIMTAGVGELVSEDESLHPQSRFRDLPQISQAKFNRFRRTTPGFTTSELAG
jgi:hypothetical protein